MARQLPHHLQGHDHWTRTHLAPWFKRPMWTAAQASALIAGFDPMCQSTGTLNMLDGLNITLPGNPEQERYASIVYGFQKKLMLDAQACKKEEASPTEWLSFAEKFEVTPDWIQFAIDEGLWPSEKTPLIPIAAPSKGVAKNVIISAFEGLYFDRDKWKKYLGDPPDWLKECRVAKGNKSASAKWNPVLIAAALFDKKIHIKKLDAAFVGLKDWADKWRETSAPFRD